MATVGVQQKDVNLAAEELLKVGDRPTVEKIRQILGRGSPNTVAPLLNEWFKTLPVRLKGGPVDERGEVPLELAKPLVGLLKAAVAHETQQLQAERNQLGEKQRALESREAELEAREAARAPLVAQLQAQLAQAALDLVEARQETRSALDVAQNERVRNSELVAHMEQAAQIAAADRSALVARHDSVELGLREQHAATERRLLLQVDEARQAAKSATAELNRLRDESRQAVEAAQAQFDALSEELQTQRERRQRLEGQLEERDRLTQELHVSRDALNDQVRQLAEQLLARDEAMRLVLLRTATKKPRNRTLRAAT